MDTSVLENAVSRYVEAFEKSEIEIIKNLYAEDAVMEDPVGSSPRRGMKEIVEFYEPAIRAGMKIRLLGKPRIAGNSVAFLFEGKMPGLTIQPIDVFELNVAGKIQRMLSYWNDSDIHFEIGP